MLLHIRHAMMVLVWLAERILYKLLFIEIVMDLLWMLEVLVVIPLVVSQGEVLLISVGQMLVRL